LPDTVASRSIRVLLKRRTAAEHVERFRRATADATATGLRERLADWAEQHESALAIAEPLTPDELGDRSAECWEPLLAIADLAGQEWPARARSAAVVLSARSDESSPSTGVLLLGAIRAALRGRENVPTDELLDDINGNDELPFGGWAPSGLTPRRLAALLKPYEVRASGGTATRRPAATSATRSSKTPLRAGYHHPPRKRHKRHTPPTSHAKEPTNTGSWRMWRMWRKAKA